VLHTFISAEGVREAVLRIHGRGLRVGVVLRDPATASRVIEAARSHGFRPFWALSPEELPLDVEVVLHDGSYPAQRSIASLELRGGEDPEEALLRALSLYASRRPGGLEVAVDPGIRTGAVFVKGGFLLCSGVFSGPGELLDAIRSVSRAVGEEPRAIYVGMTSAPPPLELVEELKRAFPRARIEMVPEGPMRDLRVPEDLKGDELDAYFIYLRAVTWGAQTEP